MIPNLIRVEGHTDNLQIPFGSDLFQKFKDNWELSGERALSVLRYLTDLGLDPSRISYAGYAETRPIESNDTPEGRAYNRRVEIIILREYK